MSTKIETGTIHPVVREHYAEAARRNNSCCGGKAKSSCCGEKEVNYSGSEFYDPKSFEISRRTSLRFRWAAATPLPWRL